MDNDVILHVGMYKCASTFLQRKVFPFLRGVYFPHGREDRIRNFIHQLPHRNPLLVDTAAEKQWIDREIEAKSGAGPVLISHESLFGWVYRNFTNNKAVTDLLKQIFPRARILVIIRRQDEWLESAYTQTIHEGHSVSLKHYLGWRDGKFHESLARDGADIRTDVRQINPLPFIRNYMELFGKDRVLVLPYELLRKNRDAFIDRICTFIGVASHHPDDDTSVNRSYSLVSACIARALNPILPGAKSKARLRRILQTVVDRVIYIPNRFIKPGMRRRIMELHEKSNRELAELIGIDLAEFGYYPKQGSETGTARYRVEAA